MESVQLTLLGRADCELCEELHTQLMRDARVASSGITVIDIDSRPDLLPRFNFRVPVLLNGNVEIFEGRPNAELSAALDAAFAGS
ncbi:MAG: glutaredoxin family protein [Gammaproteobacteria bacterium]